MGHAKDEGKVHLGPGESRLVRQVSWQLGLGDHQADPETRRDMVTSDLHPGEPMTGAVSMKRRTHEQESGSQAHRDTSTGGQ